MIDERFIGEIRLFAGDYEPDGWAFCKGQGIRIDRNTALFAILRTQYGGDGISMFQLPNLAPLKEADGGPTPIHYAICLSGTYPDRNSAPVEATIGQIRLFAGDYAPAGWAFCNGQSLTISLSTALYSILGTQYGGDGTRTFQLPNLAPLKEADYGPTPIQYIIATEGMYPSRPF